MIKRDVMEKVSRARAACERANAALKGTAHRISLVERGPDPNRPHLIPLNMTERQAQIVQAVMWAVVAEGRAREAVDAVTSYATQNGVTAEMIREQYLEATKQKEEE